MKTKQDHQPRRASKDVPLEKLHPASDMGKRAKSGEKINNQGMPSRKKSSEQSPATSGTKPAR